MYVQIVQFRLKPETSSEQFMELTKLMVNLLKSKQGFLFYELYKGEAWWFDRIVWENKKQAENGLKEFIETNLAKELIALVENDYRSLFGEAVVVA